MFSYKVEDFFEIMNIIDIEYPPNMNLKDFFDFNKKLDIIILLRSLSLPYSKVCTPPSGNGIFSTIFLIKYEHIVIMITFNTIKPTHRIRGSVFVFHQFQYPELFYQSILIQIVILLHVLALRTLSSDNRLRFRIIAKSAGY